MIPDAEHGVCAGCQQSILGGTGVHIDADRRMWHPACHTTKTSAAPAAQEAPKRRGRPPKIAAETPQ